MKKKQFLQDLNKTKDKIDNDNLSIQPKYTQNKI